MSRIAKAAKGTVFVQLFSVIGSVLSLVAVPLYLQWLGQERYGLLLTALSFAGLLMFADAGLSWSSMLLISQAYGREDRNEIAKIIRNSISLAVVSCIVVGVIVLPIYLILQSESKPTWLPQSPEAPALFLVVAASTMTTLLLSAFVNVFQGLQDLSTIAIYQGVSRVLGSIASLLAAFLGAPLAGVLGANIACVIGIGVITVVHCVRKYPWAFRLGPIWERDQIVRQLRAGGKSFAMQIGLAFGSSAAVLAISSQIGVAAVPLFTVPLTLINLPLSVANSFTMLLQPAYGEAMGRNETEWIATTIRTILRKVFALLGFLVAGYIVLARPTISLWTHHHLEIPEAMILSTAAMASLSAIFNVFRFALTGMNRHRIASLAEIVNSSLFFGLALIIVRYFGYQWIGLAFVLSSLLTSAWILPRELRVHLRAASVWPAPNFWMRLLGAFAPSLIVGELAWMALQNMPSGLTIPLVGLVITLIYGLIASRLFPTEFGQVNRLVAKFVPGLKST